MQSGFSLLKRQEAERLDAERQARAIQLDALDGMLSFRRREALAERLDDHQVALLAGLAKGARSRHTMRALAEDLDFLAEWSRTETGAPLPLPPDTDLVLRLITAQQSASPAPALSTLKRRITSWATLTRANAGSDEVFADTEIRAALAGTRKDGGKTMASPALGADGLKRLLATCSGESLTDCRDRALLLTAFRLALKPADIAALGVEDVAKIGSGSFAHRRPQDAKAQLEESDTASNDAFSSLSLWLAKSGLSSGPLFRPVNRWGKPGRLGLTAQSVRLIVKARAMLAGLDPAGFTAHSLR